MIEKVLCQAAVHKTECGGRRLADTIDHFTPRCIDRLRSMRDKAFYDPTTLNSPDNLIPMWNGCHTLKDRSTPEKLKQVRNQIGGVFIRLGGHQ